MKKMKSDRNRISSDKALNRRILFDVIKMIVIALTVLGLLAFGGML